MPSQSPQFDLDLAGVKLETRLNAQWRESMERDARNWTPEAMAKNWSGTKDGISDADIAAFRSHLYNNGWQTRRQISSALGWTDRRIREVAEYMGANVIRGQSGFRLTEQISRDNAADLARAMQAADAAGSQARKQAAYCLALRQRIHAIVG